MILEEIEVELQFLEPVRVSAGKDYRESHFRWKKQYMQSYGIAKGHDVCVRIQVVLHRWHIKLTGCLEVSLEWWAGPKPLSCDATKSEGVESLKRDSERMMHLLSTLILKDQWRSIS